MHAIATMILGMMGCVSNHSGTDATVVATDVVETVAIEEVEATVSAAIPTVVTVTWQTPEAGKGQVEYGLTEEYGEVTSDSLISTTEPRIIMLGLAPDRDYHFRAVSMGDGVRYVSGDQQVRTGATPADLPSVTAEILNASATEGGFTILTALDLSSYILVINKDGEVVWHWAEMGFIPQAYLAAESQEMVYLWQRSSDPGETEAQIVRLAIDGSVEMRIDAPGAHHSFVMLPEGGYAYPAYSFLERDGMPIFGDDLIEASIDGSSVKTVWRASNAIGEEEWGFMCQGEGSAWEMETGADWFHANSLSLDETRALYLLSSASLGVFQIDRNGQTLWRLGNVCGLTDFRMVGDEGFGTQHSVLPVPSGILMFDNGSKWNESRAVLYTLDVKAATATLDWTWSSQEGWFTPTLGSVELLPLGNTLISWGGLGVMTEVTPDGEVCWQAATVSGTGAGYAGYARASRVSSLYAP